jgi:hypothetical protein
MEGGHDAHDSRGGERFKELIEDAAYFAADVAAFLICIGGMAWLCVGGILICDRMMAWLLR